MLLGYWLVGCLLAAVGHSLLSTHAQRRNNKKKLDILMVKIKLAPRNLVPLVNRKLSNNNIAPFPLYPFFSFIQC